ncbi:hypothetical protein ACHAXM_011869 [Skeletonema potamos]
MLEERNDATRKYDDLEDRFRDTLLRLEEATARNEKLQADSEESVEVVQSMEAEIESIKTKLSIGNQSAEKLEEMHSEVARIREDYDIAQHTLRQVRADNEELRKDAESQISELMCEIEVIRSHQIAADRENEKTVRENEQLTSQIDDLKDTLRLVRANNEELRNDSQEEINDLMLEIKRLKSQQSAATRNNDEVVRENEHLRSNMNAVEDTLRQVRADNEELRNDAESQINELTNKLHGLQEAAEKDAEEKSTMEQYINKIETEMARYEQELANVKKSCVSTSDESDHERAQLYEKISSLERENDELAKQLCEVQEVAKKDAGEKRQLQTQIEQYEQDLSCCEEELSEAKAALKSKSDQVENAIHCVESKMIGEKDSVIDRLREELSQSVTSNNDLAEKLNYLQQDNGRLEGERSIMAAEIDKYQRNVNRLASKIAGSQRLLDEAKQRCSNMEQLESEKVALTRHLNTANEMIERMRAQIEQASAKLLRSQEENVTLKERESELRGSVSRVKELVEAMKRRNTELEEENESLRIKGEALEMDIHAALAERDDACARNDKLSSERDAAVQGHENAKKKLDILAAEFEADYETMRSEVDIMTTENKILEDRVAILEAGKASFECKSDRILERDNALVGQHERLMREYQKQSTKMADLKEQLKALTLVVKRLDLEKDQFFAERATLRETIKMMSLRLRSHKNEPSPRASPSSNKKAAFFRARQ